MRRTGLAVGTLRGDEQVIECSGNLAPDSIVELGSITKVFTGVLLADLALEGLVRLDDPVRPHLPPGLSLPPPVGREISLAELASHLSGLRRAPRGMWRLALRDLDNPYAGLREAELAEALARTRLRRPPGRFRYSNLGGGLLGIALSHRAGVEYEQLVCERICAPLGMPDTMIEPTAEQRPRVAQGHSFVGRPRAAFALPGLPGAGALRSTVPEMLRFLRATVDLPPTRLGKALELARTPRATAGRGLSIGLGWLVLEPRRGPVTLVHNGGTGRFRSFAGVVLERRAAVFVASSTNRSVDRVALRLLEKLA
ncbi:MAG: beta-lactamase family protein [Thermoleophilia bacterium]|nr:beta-lactamase family protein [Thermoleophilia bacterium]